MGIPCRLSKSRLDENGAEHSLCTVDNAAKASELRGVGSGVSLPELQPADGRENSRRVDTRGLQPVERRGLPLSALESGRETAIGLFHSA
jgi:hypothetical protein